MKRKKHSIRNLHHSNDAVAGVLVAVLSVGLILSVISIVQTVYVPKWMTQKEAEHMDAVANQFNQLKFAIDTQTTTKQIIPISTSITLGSKEMEFLVSQRAYGSLDIVFNEYMINITNATQTVSYSQMGIIKYSSKNTYFLDQSYIYENGAIVLHQSSGDAMVTRPSLFIAGGSANFYMVRISGIGGKTSLSGYGSYPIQTMFSCNTTTVIPQVSQINITTKYPKAWNTSLNNTLVQAWLDPGSAFQITDIPDGIQINFFDTNKMDFTIIMNDINVQIGPGWIEQT